MFKPLAIALSLTALVSTSAHADQTPRGSTSLTGHVEGLVGTAGRGG